MHPLLYRDREKRELFFTINTISLLTTSLQMQILELTIFAKSLEFLLLIFKFGKEMTSTFVFMIKKEKSVAVIYESCWQLQYVDICELQKKTLALFTISPSSMFANGINPCLVALLASLRNHRTAEYQDLFSLLHETSEINCFRISICLYVEFQSWLLFQICYLIFFYLINSQSFTLVVSYSSFVTNSDFQSAHWSR